ncbi:MAG: hypothetical protein C0412_03990 [Flavobacterium sp.]|nr:hypothetical protein [Flavobacterium sp.]
MDLTKLLPAIENDVRLMAEKYYDDIVKCDKMENYKNLDREKVISREVNVFKNMVSWLQTGRSDDNAEKFYENIGLERFKEGFPLAEINYALHIDKLVVWNYLISNKESGLFTNTEEFQNIAILLSNYFDLGSFYMTRGYINGLYNALETTGKFKPEELQSLFRNSAFDEDFEASDIIWYHV